MITHMLTKIEACADCFHTATGTAFADLLINRHRETRPIRSDRFQRPLPGMAAAPLTTRGAPSAEALRRALASCRDQVRLTFLRDASADLPACCRFQSRSAEAQSSNSARFSTTRALRSRGSGQRFDPAAPIPYWRYPVSRDRQRPSSPRRSETLVDPNVAPVKASRGRKRPVHHHQ